MSDNNDKKVQQRLTEIRDLIRQKNEVIYHLTTRIKNQQKQIEMLVMDAEEKHMNEITKYYAKSYDKYLKYGKYLLLKIDEIQGNGIYLPKYAKIVHFGQIQLYGKDKIQIQPVPVNYQNNLINNQNRNPGQQPKNNNTDDQQNVQNVQGLKQLDLNKKQSISLQASCKGLSLQIEELKQKLKAYTNIVNKSASKMDQIKEQPSFQDKSPVQSIIYHKTPGKWEQQVPKQLEKHQNDDEKHQEQNMNNKIVDHQKQAKRMVQVSQFPSPSPLKKKNNTKTIFIRKRG